jgi:hypothetical protein
MILKLLSIVCGDITQGQDIAEYSKRVQKELITVEKESVLECTRIYMYLFSYSLYTVTKHIK